MFWCDHGHLEEGARWFTEILTRGDPLPPKSHARAVSGAALMTYARHDDRHVRALLEESLRLDREVGDMPGIALTAAALGHGAAVRRESIRAEELLEESLTVFGELGDEWFVALVLNFRGIGPLSRGEHDLADRLFAEGLRAARGAGGRLPLLLSLHNLAVAGRRRVIRRMPSNY